MSLAGEPPLVGRARGAALAGLFHPLVDRLFDPDGSFVRRLDRRLDEAHVGTPVEQYLAWGLVGATALGGLLWLAGTVAVAVVVGGGVGPLLGLPVPNGPLATAVETLRVPALVAVGGLTLGAVGAAVGFGTVVAVPFAVAAGRRREIDTLLPEAVAYMHALSAGGMNEVEVMAAMAEAEDTYGEVASEFAAVVRETRYFDVDYRRAVERQAERTPSDDLADFLTDLLSVSDTGGDITAFLRDATDKYRTRATRRQEERLDTLEMFGEVYLAVSVFPVLLLVILVVMRLLGGGATELLLVTVYGLVPLLGLCFLILLSTVTADEPSDGYLDPPDDSAAEADERSPLSTPAVDAHAESDPVFDRIRRREGTRRAMALLRNPHGVLREHPNYTLAATVPLALALLVGSVVSGAAPTTPAGLVAAPIRGTFLWFFLPMYVVLAPLAIFRAWNHRSRFAVLDGLADALRKLASTNRTGLTVLESLGAVAADSRGVLAREFETVSTQVAYGMRLDAALVAFNNRFHVPRLARTVKLISRAERASSDISAVLLTAARTNETQAELEAERRARTRMQVVIIVMTFLTLLAVMAILEVQFIDVLAGLVAQMGGVSGSVPMGAVDAELLSLLFFHAVTIQAVVSGLVAGAMRHGDPLAGAGYVVALSTVALVVWAGVA